MKMNKKPLMQSIIPLLILCLSACSSFNHSFSTAISVSGVTFQNIGYYDAENVKLRAVATNGQVACNKIEANSSCGTGFPVKQYQGGELELSWEMAGRHYTQYLVIPLPKEAIKGQQFTAVILIADNGQHDVRLTKNSLI